jgi:hypothetical protein
MRARVNRVCCAASATAVSRASSWFRTTLDRDRGNDPDDGDDDEEHLWGA